MATSFAPVLLRLFDDQGALLAGGTVDTYEAGTTTPLATYQDLAGEVANTNPVVLDAGGSATIRVTDGVAYKFVVKDADGDIIYTDDNIIVGEAESTSESQLLVSVTYAGTPGAQGWLGGAEIVNSVTFPIDFDGSSASAGTNPAASYAITVKKNGVACGTVTFDTAGVATFATTSGATVACAFSDRLDFYGPDTVGTAADILITLIGDIA
jgi:hypothetical protein